MSDWIKDQLPPEGERVMCEVTGKPRDNVSVYNLHETGCWYKGTGWVLDTWPDAKLEVTRWKPIESD